MRSLVHRNACGKTRIASAGILLIAHADGIMSISKKGDTDHVAGGGWDAVMHISSVSNSTCCQ